MTQFIHGDIGAMQSAVSRGTANADSQTGNAQTILGTNEGTQAGWHGSASRAFGDRFTQTDSSMSLSNQDQHRIMEANQQSVQHYQAGEADNVGLFNAINP
jgi:uncharacterized protein YukE